jgi:hypothetical protein
VALEAGGSNPLTHPATAMATRGGFFMENTTLISLL